MSTERQRLVQQLRTAVWLGDWTNGLSLFGWVAGALLMISSMIAWLVLGRWTPVLSGAWMTASGLLLLGLVGSVSFARLERRRRRLEDQLEL